MHLPEHRPYATHLEHQPLQHSVTSRGILRQELAGLLREINQDRPGLEECERLSARAIAIDNRGNLAVGIYRHKLGLELIALGNVDFVNMIGEAGLLEHDRDLAAIGRAPGVEIDHRQQLHYGLAASHSGPEGPRQATG